MFLLTQKLHKEANTLDNRIESGDKNKYPQSRMYTGTVA